MTKKKSPQAPKGSWRYGIVKRTYKTKLAKQTFSEVCYELVEVFDEGRAWTAEAITLAGSSRKDLIVALKCALQDLEKYEVIVEKKVIVRDMRGKK